MQKKVDAMDVRVLVKMVDSGRIECAGSPNDTMNLVAFCEQEVSQIRSILSGNTGY
jgi:hypothetical protein